MGISTCRGICKPAKFPRWNIARYDTHVYCRVCTNWSLRSDVWKKVYCQCCHTRVAWKPKARKYRVKYNLKPRSDKDIP